MRVANISFGAMFNLKIGDFNNTTCQQLNNEIEFAKQARQKGVLAPIYDVSYCADELTY